MADREGFPDGYEDIVKKIQQPVEDMNERNRAMTEALEEVAIDKVGSYAIRICQELSLPYPSSSAERVLRAAAAKFNR